MYIIITNDDNSFKCNMEEYDYNLSLSADVNGKNQMNCTNMVIWMAYSSHLAE